MSFRPRITVVGVGGAGTNAVNNMITSHLEGVEFVACNTDAQSLRAFADRAPHPARHLDHPGARRGRPARDRPRRGRGGDRGAARPAAGQPHGVHHRRHGWRHRHRGRAGDRARGARAGHPDGRRGHQAVPLRGRAPHARRRGRARRAAAVRRHPDRDPEPEPVPDRQRAHHLRRGVQARRQRAAHGRARRHRPDGDAGPDQPRLRRHPDRDERDGQGDDGHRRRPTASAARSRPPRPRSPTRCSTRCRCGARAAC